MSKDAAIVDAMKWCFIGMALCVLAACATNFKESETTDVNLHVNWVDKTDMHRIKTAMNVRLDAYAFTKWYDTDDGRECFVFMQKPVNGWDFINLWTLGHEVLHCTEGKYHL